MYTQLKQAMTAAGITVSEGHELTVADMAKARDFCHFNGHNIGENFHLFGKQEGVTSVAPEVPAVETPAETDEVSTDPEVPAVEIPAETDEGLDEESDEVVEDLDDTELDTEE